MQTKLDFHEGLSYEEAEFVKAITCLLKHLPREQWFAYIGLINGRYSSLREIVEQSMKEASIHKMHLDDIKENIVEPSALLVKEVTSVIDGASEPRVSCEQKLDIYRHVVNAEIEAGKHTHFAEIRKIEQIVNKQLPVEDDELKQELRDKQFELE